MRIRSDEFTRFRDGTRQHCVTTTVRAAVYLRISLDLTGERLAIARQREDCQAIAEQRGWKVVGEYTDNSISASDRRKDRPGYNRLVLDYEAGAFDALLTYDLDRLTRQPRQLEDWIEAAEERGLLLVTANGEADLTTDGGRMYARIKVGVARAESERKSARQRRAASQRAEIGKPPLGVRLTGYTSFGETVDAEAAVVRELFRRFGAGESLSAVVRWLNTTGLPPRHSAAWTRSSARSMLTNPRYAGRAIYDGKPTGGSGRWEPMVDEGLFDVIQVKLDDPRRLLHHGTERKHLGSGLYVCGICGRRVNAHLSSSRRAGMDHVLRYMCPDKHFERMGAGIDEFVTAFIRARLERPDVADLLADVQSDEEKRITAEVSRLRGRLRVIEADYDSGLIDGRRYKSASEKAEAELAVAESAQARMAARFAAVAPLMARDPVAAYDAAPLGTRQAIIRFFVTVRLMPTAKGRRGFDSRSVILVDPKTGKPWSAA